MKNRIFLISLLALALAGCNKEDYIEPEPPVDDSNFRPVTEQSSAFQNRVFEYMPGPGQFINETITGGFTGNERTMQDAIAYAEQRLNEQKFISLGSFGGYIIVGFDHSIKNTKGDYDFAVLGNAMDSSNEPGIIWVMQDSNGNGLPDDRWYELRGSETGQSGTISNYSVTYYRPAKPKEAVEWVDSEGNRGTVDYLKAYHKQDYYYPAWVSEDSYTLSGTRLEARTSKDETTGFWSNAPFSWGYVDNLGTDSFGENGLWVGFKISNAMQSDGEPIELDYIDFIKVQQGVLAKAGWLGENSCEVFSFADLNILNK